MPTVLSLSYQFQGCQPDAAFDGGQIFTDNSDIACMGERLQPEQLWVEPTSKASASRQAASLPPAAA